MASDQTPAGEPGGEPGDAPPKAGAETPVLLASLLPPGEPLSVVAAARGWSAGRPPGTPAGRPHVLLNMISTADGRATLGGRSGTISDRADRELFHELRATVDAVMAGAGTVRVERYGRIIASAERRRARVQRGLGEEPIACIVSGRLALDPAIPLLGEPDAHVVIVTSSAASLPQSAGLRARIEYVRSERDGRLDLPAAFAELRERFGIESLLCEGGPHLNSQLLGAALVDELLLSFAPTLGGGEEADGQAPLRILAGPELDPPIALELLGVLESDSELFLRYGVRSASAASPALV
jgi:riboflavin-specific deaminase-like protein